VEKTPDCGSALVCRSLMELDIKVPEDGDGEKEIEYCKSAHVTLPGNVHVYAHFV
jgi:hypothetical protein